jgi:hypothetical protein
MWLILAIALHYGGSIVSLTYKSTTHPFSPLHFHLAPSFDPPPTFRDISLPFSILGYYGASLLHEPSWQK